MLLGIREKTDREAKNYNHIINQTVPSSGSQTSTTCQMSGGIGLDAKCTINLMCLNHPEIIPAPLWWQTVFQETGPCKKVADLHKR